MTQIKTFYNGISSCIINNGHCSSFFQLQRGVRQGDPLSSYIFILVVELLACALKFDPNINGINIDESEFLIIQYADDTTLLLDDNEVSLNSALNLINAFSEISGLKVNFEKTQAVWIGAKRGCVEEIKTEKPLLWSKNGIFKLLGIRYELYKNDIYKQNFTEKITVIKKLLNDWSLRNLSLIGKVTVIKTLAIPILVQSLTSLQNLSQNDINEVQSVLFKFLWDKKTEKIKRNLLIQSLENGGLRMPHVESFQAALKISWIKKLIDPTYSAPWKTLILPKFEKFGGDKLWLLNPEGLIKLANNFNSFWKGIIIKWATLRDSSTATPETILSQPLWLNNNIKINNKTIIKHSWIKNDIFFVNDLINETGNFLSYEEFVRKFPVNTNILDFYGLLSAIPREWKIKLKDCNKLEDVSSSHITYLKKHLKVTKYFTNIQVEKLLPNSIKSQQKWEEKLHKKFSKEIWKEINLRTAKLTDDTSIRTFQYKINNRILYTNDMLMKFKIKDTELCTFCNETKETISSSTASLI